MSVQHDDEFYNCIQKDIIDKVLTSFNVESSDSMALINPTGKYIIVG